MILRLLTYPRAVFMIPFGILHTIFWSIVTVTIGLIRPGSKWLDRVVGPMWSGVLLKMTGVEVEVRGAENVPMSGKGFLLLFNHTSLLDIPVLFYHFPRPIRFGAKIELFKVPFFGAAMRACGILPIDRANRNKVMRVYDEAITRVNRGECFALAPEGTRQFSDQLGRFKRGPFEFAVNAHADIIPAVLYGAHMVLPKHSIFPNLGRWKRTIVISILPKVSTEGVQIENIANLQQEVFDLMQPELSKLATEWVM